MPRLTKIAIISDMHKSHYEYFAWARLVNDVKQSLLSEQPDLLIDAGDCETDMRAELGIDGLSVMSVRGNHDWWGHDFTATPRRDAQGNKRETQAYVSDDFLAIGCTLWTDFDSGNPLSLLACRDWPDYRNIRNCSPYHTYEEHLEDRAWLRKYDRRYNAAHPDVVVTHHAPSYLSVHEKYRGKTSNAGFASSLEDLILGIEPKYWIHGHMHDPMSYVFGTTHVICHPCGYPHERQDRTYKPLYIQV